MSKPTCVMCGKGKRTKDAKPELRKMVEADPFCSSSCANRHYGVVHLADKSAANGSSGQSIPKREKTQGKGTAKVFNDPEGLQGPTRGVNTERARGRLTRERLEAWRAERAKDLAKAARAEGAERA